MKVDSIANGIVIDHISPGKAMELYSLLNLEALECTVALIKNVPSEKMGRKDIIKVDQIIDLDFDVLGYMDPGITVNIIKNGEVAERINLTLPERVVDVLKCKNPRCITSTEQEIVHEFKLTDPEKQVYRCIYCDQQASK